MSSPTIELLTAATPNGQKISIFLEELGLPYTTTSIDLGADEQKAASFLATNPNGHRPLAQFLPRVRVWRHFSVFAFTL
jgi:glutathione S-transferase